MCVRGHVYVCQRSCICVLGVMYMCQGSCICVFEVSIASLFLRFFNQILEMFRRYFVCFILFVFNSDVSQFYRFFFITCIQALLNAYTVLLFLLILLLSLVYKCWLQTGKLFYRFPVYFYSKYMHHCLLCSLINYNIDFDIRIRKV